MTELKRVLLEVSKPEPTAMEKVEKAIRGQLNRLCPYSVEVFKPDNMLNMKVKLERTLSAYTQRDWDSFKKDVQRNIMEADPNVAEVDTPIWPSEIQHKATLSSLRPGMKIDVDMFFPKLYISVKWKKAKK